MIATMFRRLSATLLWCVPMALPATELPVVKLNAGIHLIHAEVADTPATRMQGLMYRKTLDGNRGMVFIFDEAGRHCMWMRNTYIPLSAAFIDDRGTIVNIADMTPQSEDLHCAARPVRYVLEMNQGWFAARGLAPGARIVGVDALPAGR